MIPPMSLFGTELLFSSDCLPASMPLCEDALFYIHNAIYSVDENTEFFPFYSYPKLRNFYT